MRVHLIDIPSELLIGKNEIKTDFTECFSIKMLNTRAIDIDTLVYDCFDVFTIGWVDCLFRIRNWLVKPFNLNSRPDDLPVAIQRKEIIKGGKVAFFDVADINNDEVLNCKVSQRC